MKKWFLLFLLSAAALSTAASADSVRLEIHTTQRNANAEELLSVKVEMAGNTGFSAVSFVLTWDHEKLECLNAYTGALLDGTLSAVNPSAAEGAILAAASEKEISGDGTLGSFIFRPKVKLPEYSFGLENVILTAPDGTPVAYAVFGGTGEQETAVLKPPDIPEEGSVEHPDTEDEKTNPLPGLSEDDPSVLLPENPDHPDGEENAKSAEPETGESEPGGTPSSNEHDAAGEGSITFTDTADSWAEEYILKGAQLGLFSGYSDGTFRPDNQLTRAQFMMVLWNHAGRPESKNTSPFQDMSNQIENFQKAVSWAYENGYIHGTTPDTFSPSAPLTRQAAMKILFGYDGNRSGLETMLFGIYDNAFKDSSLISQWGRAGMYWGVFNGIVTPGEDRTLDPRGIITRGHMASMLVRYVTNMAALT